MSTQHTPGPWRIGTTPPNGEQTIGTQQGLMVAVATTGANTPTEANARLIAAAPDLLEALKACIPHLERDDHHTDALSRERPHYAAARAAIAKATGAV